MNGRQKQIIRKLLDALDEREGRPASQTLLHGQVTVKLEDRVTLTEFENALSCCDSRGWLTSLPDELGSMQWTLTQKGRAARINV
jgi:hypothetical protein